MDKTYLLKRCGNLSQIAYARTSTINQGQGNGMKIIDVNNGNGINLCILESRGLDLGSLSYNGVNIGFIAKPGYVHNTHTDGFLQQFQGGMLYTCGMLNIGVAQEDSDVGKQTIHGALSSIHADEVSIKIDWDNGVIIIRGVMRESALFSYNLSLERVIKIYMEKNLITIDDTITNNSFREEYTMMLYHFNFGWPMLSEFTKLSINNKIITPRDDEAAKGIGQWNEFQEPCDVYAEQVFYHKPMVDENGYCVAKVYNPKLNIGVNIKFLKEQLPYLIEWKSMASGDYALGIEPATAQVAGRNLEQKENRLLLIKPQESKNFHLELEIY